MANYMPLVYNLDDDPSYLPRTTISPLMNPYFIIADSEIRFDCTARGGPNLFSLSAPFIKSYTSLIKFVPI